MTGSRERGERVRVERSAGGVVVRTIDGAPHILLIKDPYGKWGLPKGHIEGDEKPPATALREVREETGLEDLTLGPDLGTIRWSFRQKGVRVRKSCQFYLMSSAVGDPEPEREEGISDCRFLPMPEAVRGITYDNAREVVRRAVALVDNGRGGEKGSLPWKAPLSQ